MGGERERETGRRAVRTEGGERGGAGVGREGACRYVFVRVRVRESVCVRRVCACVRARARARYVRACVPCARSRARADGWARVARPTSPRSMTSRPPAFIAATAVLRAVSTWSANLI